MSNLLKFIACGSVDDGKSTLIGRILYDAKLIFADQVKMLEIESKINNTNSKVDYSLLLDGLTAEREQGITIDVAYRYFKTDKRSFIVADTPGHEEYTRNMAVGASFSKLAVILVDATKGISKQTIKHTQICILMGIKHIVLAINKMDLIKYDRTKYLQIKNDFLEILQSYNLSSVKVIPVSATEGDNIISKSKNMIWYNGVSILEYLETVEIDEKNDTNFILPIQRVSRQNLNFRGFQGEIVSGSINVGDEVIVLPSKEKAKTKTIYLGNKNVKKASLGNPVTLQLDKELDISRGCVLVKNTFVKVNTMFKAIVLWMDDNEFIFGKTYFIKIGTKTTTASIIKINSKIDLITGTHSNNDMKIKKNDIIVCEISLSENVVFDSFLSNKVLGSFILIDKMTNMTSAWGRIEHSLEITENSKWQTIDISRNIRAKQKSQKVLTIWFTGLSGSGKSTLAKEVERRLFLLGKHTMVIDADNIRKGLNADLSFSEMDRYENNRRIAEVSKLMNEAGLIVLVSSILPNNKIRNNVKKILGNDFFEIYVSTPIHICEKRDPKGLYKLAKEGKIKEFTGISTHYEAPTSPWHIVETTKYSIDEIVEQIVTKLDKYMNLL
jgi:sulfate adenylyltransferase, large subunit